ncbi:replicative DNA helicase [Marinicella gelatinilytica]|uniref:replicative DNA helicase n=1 Tax=Marinicella gelatinilytica TaxID=2996017 RepID=UPI002260C7A4|nr:replicative DNA helicase [Marinicella gelatinilytica]MCX7543860.1 replicative DNA helicase [Marinicella gelatinilytica]
MSEIYPINQGDATKALKTPPHSLEAEQAVLAGLMLVQSAWDKVSGLLSEEDFYFAKHKSIYQGVSFLNSQNEACDVVTLSEWLQSHDLEDKTGGLDYLTEIANNYPVASNIAAYAKIVRDRSVLRQMIEIGNQLAESAFNTEGQSADELIENAEKLVFKIREQTLKSKSGFHDIKNVLAETIERLEKLSETDGEITGIPYGWDDLDRMTAGLHNSDLVVVAGRPAMGKTSFAINIAERAACSNQHVAVFSMEMAATQLVTRMFSSLSQIDSRNLKLGRISDSEWPRLAQTNEMLQGASIYIDDTPALTPNEVLSKCRRLKNTKGLDLVVIDYLQLMQVKGKVSENRANEISEISRGLKAMAKELNVPVIALSQLNRSLEQRPNKRPIMSDLRESGAIEQDADLIIFIYRDEVYNPETEDKGVAEIIIGKHRNGSIGKVELLFRGAYTRFDNLDKRHFDVDVEHVETFD